MQAWGVYTVYLHNKVLRAVFVREADARLIAERWQAEVHPVKIEVKE